MVLELHPWRFELEFFKVCYPVDTPTDIVFEPKLNAQQCVICEAFFFKMLSAEHIMVFWFMLLCG